MDELERLRTYGLDGLFDIERRRMAAAYAAAQRRWRLIGMAALLIYLALWVFTPAGVRLGQWVSAHVPWLWAQVALAFLAVGVGVWFLDVLFSIPGEVLARRYGQSTQDWEHWLTDRLKEGLLEGGIGLVVVDILYVLLAVGGAIWWVWAALLTVGLLVLLTIIMPVFIAPLFFRFTPIENEDLRRRLLRLADDVGVPVVDVYRFDMSTRTTAANAAVIGLGRTRRIILGDTLLQAFTPEEIEGVLAHELAHHVHRDMLWGLLMNSLLAFVGFLLLDRVLAWVSAVWQVPPYAPHTVPVFFLFWVLYGLAVMPLVNGWSRTREWLADMFAVAVTERGRTYARALARLADQNLAELWPPRMYVVWFGSHPPLGERILLAWGNEETRTTVGQTPDR